jgi:dolichol-phosphate mannosyltransferase
MMDTQVKENRPLISIVIPCYNEAMVFPFLRKELLSLKELLFSKYAVEILLINDGSRDDTWNQIVSFAMEDSSVRAINLSRNFGHQMAITCGYDFARGDAVISMDADLQDPPEVVLDLVREWQNGTDVVFAVRIEREGEKPFKLWTAKMFYRLFRIMGHPSAHLDSGDFRLMSKRSIEALRRLREQYRYIRGMAGWVGFRTAKVEYSRRARPAGASKYSIIRMLSFAMDAIISFSFLPLRLAYIFSAIGLLLVLGFLAQAFIVNHDKPLAPGWLSLIFSIVIFGFLNLLSLGIIGEYIGRIYGQTKNRPLYLISDLIEEGQQKNADPFPAPQQ